MVNLEDQKVDSNVHKKEEEENYNVGNISKTIIN